jgi:hypothetical protein
MPQSLYPFALLACPVGMGLMMWLMMRGNKDKTPQDRVPPKQDDVTRLQDEIDALRAEVGSRRGETTQLRQEVTFPSGPPLGSRL